MHAQEGPPSIAVQPLSPRSGARGGIVVLTLLLTVACVAQPASPSPSGILSTASASPPLLATPTTVPSAASTLSAADAGRLLLISATSNTYLPDGTHAIAFWVAGLGGSGRAKIGDGVQAQWSPGGTRVYITGVGSDCKPTLTSVKPDETDALVLRFDLRIGDGPFWWSPNGKHVAFIRYHDLVQCKHASAGLLYEPWVMDADGSHQRRLATDGFPTWKADGEALALLRASDPNAPPDSLSVVDLAGTVLASLGPEPGVYYEAPTWSPDGTRLAFGRTEAVAYGLDVASSALTGLVQLSPPDANALNAGPAGWSPDGSALIFSLQTADARNLFWIVRFDGQAPRLLSPAGVNEVSAAWSPSGLSIAVARDGVAPDGVSPGVLVLDRGGATLVALGAGQDPSWQPALQPLVDAS
jgi:dipeptidyl aminopeptidase/acylaminoacyl peptidase